MTSTAAAAATESAAQPAPPSLWRNREFMLLWTSQVVSTVGTRVTSVAYPLLVLAITGSPVQAGLVAFAQTLPFLIFFLPAGAFVDRWDRKRVMLVSEAGRALALGSVAVAAVMGVLSVAQLVVVAFVEGSLFVFFDLCEGAALPRIVPASQLSTAIAQNQARAQGADLVGQPLGGLLFSISRALPFAADAMSYVVSLVAIWFIKTPLQEPNRPPAQGSLRQQIGEGLSTVMGQPFLRAAILTVTGINFVFNGMGLVMIVRAQSLGADAALIGTMFAFFGAGGIIGSVFAPAIQRRFGSRTVIVGITWIWVVQMVALAFAPNVLVLGIVAGIGAIAAPAFNVVIGEIVYRVTPDRLLGRVRSVIKLLAWGSIPVGALAAGILAGTFGALNTLYLLAAVLAVVAAIATFAPGMRQVPGESR